MNRSEDQPAQGLNLLVVMRLGDRKAVDKLTPLIRCPSVRRVTLIRHAAVDLESPKLRQTIHRSSLDQGVARMRPFRSMRNVVQCITHGLAAARKERFDAVVGFNFTPYGIAAWLIAKLSRTRSVVALIGADFNTRLNQPITGKILMAILRRCDRVTIFSDKAKQTLVARGLSPNNIVVLPNTVNSERFKPDPQAAPRFDLVFTGYLIPRKGVDLLLQAVKKMESIRQQRATVLIIGDGVERPALEALAQQLGLDDVVTFHGWSGDVASHLRTAKVFVLLSAAEGLPIAMLEAMSTGLPAVVSDVGANAEVVRDGHNGYVIPWPVDTELVAKRLAQLLDDPEHYEHCRQAALGVHETHGYAHTTQKWGQLLSAWQEG